MKKKLNISCIAKTLRISPSTVSKALNDRKDVSLKTKRRVRAMAEKMEYKPDYLARALVMKETRTIGLIVPTIEASFFPDIARSISDYMDKCGYRVFLSWSKGKEDKELSLLEDLKARKVDGIIIAPCGANFSFFRKQLKETYPIVTIDNFLTTLKHTPFVGTDFRKGAYLAVDFLIRHGHRKIGFMGPFRGTFSAGERIAGYHEAMNKAGIKIKENFILDTPLSIRAGYENVKKIYKKVTAIFCASDFIAIGVLNYFKEIKVKVPAEVSVMGFSNLVEARNMEIPLTTMDQKAQIIGEKACQLLFKMLHMEEIKEKINLIAPEVIARKSTGRIDG